MLRQGVNQFKHCLFDGGKLFLRQSDVDDKQIAQGLFGSGRWLSDEEGTVVEGKLVGQLGFVLEVVQGDRAASFADAASVVQFANVDAVVGIHEG